MVSYSQRRVYYQRGQAYRRNRRRRDIENFDTDDYKMALFIFFGIIILMLLSKDSYVEKTSKDFSGQLYFPYLVSCELYFFMQFPSPYTCCSALLHVHLVLCFIQLSSYVIRLNICIYIQSCIFCNKQELVSCTLFASYTYERVVLRRSFLLVLSMSSILLI